jgi:hypothetical protein
MQARLLRLHRALNAAGIMKKTTGFDRSQTSKWRPQTRAVRAGTWRSEHGETS